MPYCPRCGVEVDASVRRCPLCTTSIPILDAGPGEPSWPMPGFPGDPSLPYRPGRRRLGVFLTLAAVFLLAGGVSLGVDLALEGRVTWSRWPLVDLAGVLLLLGAVLAWHRRPAVWLSAWFATVVGLLAALDACDPADRWFWGLGLPLAATGAALVGVLALVRRAGGYLVPALGSAALGLALAAVDGFVSAALGRGFSWGWSLVTDLAFGPLALLFLLLHLVLPRPDLRRIFHF